MTRKFSTLEFLILGVAFTTIVAGGCIVQAPVATTNTSTNASTGFNHQGIVNNCANCHGPGKNYDALQGNYNVLTNQMLHGANPLPDCSTCHLSAVQNNQFTNWNTENIPNNSIAILAAVGVYHTNSTPTSCTACHGGLAPVQGAIDVHGNTVPAHTSTYMGSFDCATCHGSATGLDWTKGL